MNSSQSTRQPAWRAAARSRKELALRLTRTKPGGWGLLANQPAVGIRRPDKRTPTQGNPMSLLRKRLGLDVPEIDPVLRKLGFRDAAAVKKALVKTILA